MDRVKRRGVLETKSCRSAKFVEETESDDTIKIFAPQKLYGCKIAKLISEKPYKKRQKNARTVIRKKFSEI